MTDYFTRSPAPSREQVTPTSYVTPTVQRPGQSVKPSPRQPVGQSPSCGPLPLQPPAQRGSASLSRAFSLASADLLRSAGPESRRKDSAAGQTEVVLRRQGAGAGARERPLSARLAGPAGQLADGGSLNPPLHHSSSLNLQAERHSERGRTPVSSSSYHHRGEVAMVTPVRAVASMRAAEASEPGEALREAALADPHLLKKDGDRAKCGSVEQARSTPASPDPNNDPQTVWYEYGCV